MLKFKFKYDKYILSFKVLQLIKYKGTVSNNLHLAEILIDSTVFYDCIKYKKNNMHFIKKKNDLE